METFFLVCAILGGTIMVLQVLVGTIGGGDHDAGHDGGAGHDTGADHDGGWFVGALSIRTVAAALTFFGLGGLTATSYGANEWATLGAALGSGAAAFYLVAFIMQWLTKLKSDGTVRIDGAVGRTGSVYLRIPGSRTGLGKIHLSVQKRTVEYQAVTTGPELPTGSTIRVVAVVNSDTVEVEAA